MAKGGLGSGLDFLFDDNAAEVQVKKTVRMSEIEPNRNQPRKNFSEESIAALADSIKQYGILQPVLVRPKDGIYQIVAGERRWRAARMLGMDEIPVIIKELSDLRPAESSPCARCAPCAPKSDAFASALSREDIEAITRAVLARLGK